MRLHADPSLCEGLTHGPYDVLAPAYHPGRSILSPPISRSTRRSCDLPPPSPSPLCLRPRAAFCVSVIIEPVSCARPGSVAVSTVGQPFRCDTRTPSCGSSAGLPPCRTSFSSCRLPRGVSDGRDVCPARARLLVGCRSVSCAADPAAARRYSLRSPVWSRFSLQPAGTVINLRPTPMRSVSDGSRPPLPLLHRIATVLRLTCGSRRKATPRGEVMTAAFLVPPSVPPRRNVYPIPIEVHVFVHRLPPTLLPDSREGVHESIDVLAVTPRSPDPRCLRERPSFSSRRCSCASRLLGAARPVSTIFSVSMQANSGPHRTCPAAEPR